MMLTYMQSLYMMIEIKSLVLVILGVCFLPCFITCVLHVHTPTRAYTHSLGAASNGAVTYRMVPIAVLQLRLPTDLLPVCLPPCLQMIMTLDGTTATAGLSYDPW